MQCCYELQQYNLFEHLFPITHNTLKKDGGFKRFIHLALENTDTRILTGKSVNPAFLFAVFLWKPYLQLLEQYNNEGIPPGEGTWEAGRNTVFHQSKKTSIPKRFSIAICEIWKLQNRFYRKRGRKVFQFMEHRRFRAAYDFMCLRAQAGEIDNSECHWWTTIQSVPLNEQRKMINQNNKPRHNRNQNRNYNQPK